MLSLKTKSLSVFYKNFLINMIILIIPVLLTGSYIYQQYFKLYRSQIQSSIVDTMNRIKIINDGNLKQFQNTINQIYLNPEFSPFYFKTDPTKSLPVIKNLNTLNTVSGISDVILLYYRGDDYIYCSNHGTVPLSLIPELFAYEKWKPEDFVKKIKSTDKYYFRPDEIINNNLANYLGKRYITFFYPLPQSSVNPYGTVIFVVPEEKYFNIIKDNTSTVKYGVIIYDNENNPIISYDVGVNLKEPGLLKFLNSDCDEKSGEIVINREKYNISFVRSGETKWKYVSIIPISNIMLPLKKEQILALVFLFGVFIAGSILVYILTNLNYSPIRELKQLIDRTYSKGGSSKNEIDAIKEAINNLSGEKTLLENQVKSSLNAQKNQFILELIKGNYSDIEEINKLAGLLGINVKGNAYAVMFVHYSTLPGNAVFEKPEMIKTIEDNIPQGIRGYGIEGINEKQFVFMMIADKTDPAFIDKTFSQVLDFISSKLDVKAVLGIGRLYDDIMMISKSFIEASSALDYRLLKGNGSVIRFDDIVITSTGVEPYPYYHIDKLSQYISKANVEQVGNAISDIFKFLKQNNMPLFMARCIYLDVISLAMRQARVDTSYNENFGRGYPNVFSLASFNSIDELEEALKNVCLDICKYKKMAKYDGDSQLDKIYEYFEKHCYNYDFSLLKAAEELGMSFSRFGRYFKAETGYTLSDYINLLRINKAKKLLEDHDKKLKSIVEEIGYSDVSSFIRKFKQLVGITPKEYRKMNNIYSA